MSMLEKLNTLWPEIILGIAAAVVLIVGLSPQRALRRSTVWISGLGLVAAAAVALVMRDAQGAFIAGAFATYVKVAVCGVGLLLLIAAAEVPDESGADLEATAFDPANVSRGEFFAFMLLSLMGAMLCAGAGDLVWLFLALELTSLPTYIMVATSRDRLEAPEAGIKYFFLGALSAAIFLYGFALIYGGTGYTTFDEIRMAIAAEGLSPLVLVGLLLAIVGMCFKIAAVPMHLYAADVYQGAASPVTALLAFVPKTAGFVALILLIGLLGWPMEEPRIVGLLWILAVLTMFVGNTLALRQTNVKRVLAYSSIAHSGYMLVGLVVGPGAAGDPLTVRNGLAAVLFYLVIYGVMNLGAFAVLGMLKAKGEDAETYDDLRGLAQRHPGLAAIMAVCILALAGVPPLVGFWGKLYLFGAAISAQFIWLAILALVNSAMAAVYYLRIVGVCYLDAPQADELQVAARPWRKVSATVAAVAVVALSLLTMPLVDAARTAAVQPAAPVQPNLVQQPSPPLPAGEGT